MVCTLTPCTSLCHFSPAHIHPRGRVMSHLLWPNAPVFLLPDGVPLLVPSSLLGHWVTTAHCLRWQKTRLDGGSMAIYVLAGPCLYQPQSSLFSHIASIHWFTTYIYVSASMCLSLQVSGDTELSKAQFLPSWERVTQTQLRKNAVLGGAKDPECISFLPVDIRSPFSSDVSSVCRGFSELFGFLLNAHHLLVRLGPGGEVPVSPGLKAFAVLS